MLLNSWHYSLVKMHDGKQGCFNLYLAWHDNDICGCDLLHYGTLSASLVKQVLQVAPCLTETFLFTPSLLSYTLYLIFSFSLPDSCKPFRHKCKISLATGFHLMATVFAELNVMGWPDSSNQFSVVSGDKECLRKMFPSSKIKTDRLMVW